MQLESLLVDQSNMEHGPKHIKGKLDEKHHAGKRCEVKRKQEAEAQVEEFGLMTKEELDHYFNLEGKIDNLLLGS